MDKLVLKFTPSTVDEIEKTKGVPIANCVGDNSISNLALFIMKGLASEHGTVGVSKKIALGVIEEQLKERDTMDILIDIVEALVDSGFLPKNLDTEKMRTGKEENIEQANNRVA
jgi:hypothetical protein